MPELPEMQALAERLDSLLAGSTLTAVEVLQFAALKTVRPGPDDVAGDTFEGVARRGKYLVASLHAGPRLVVHLSQGGRIDIEVPAKSTRPRPAAVRIRVETPDGPAAVLVKEFGSERKVGLWILDADDRGPLEGLGPDPFSTEFEALVLEGTDRRRLHTFLRDQRAVAGIGRGYTDDILHAARLSPFASLEKLDDDERRWLVDVVRSVLAAALDQERERTGGLPAKLGDRFRIHRRHGEACPECRATLERVSYEAYELVYCPQCQTGGRVLADRRTSKFLR